MEYYKDIKSILTESYGNQRQCRRCFMNGKSCIYQREIGRYISSTNSIMKEADRFDKAFMLMPFKTTIDEVYRTQLEPCIYTFAKEVKRADDITMTGFVICEKICRQIQESQAVFAEISCDNPNVFYELGLAYALNKNIVLFMQKPMVSKDRIDMLEKLNIHESSYKDYDPFEMIDAGTIPFWNTCRKEKSAVRSEGITVLLADGSKFNEEINGQSFEYTVDKLCKGAIHKAISTFRSKPGSPWNDIPATTITITRKGYSGDRNSFEAVERSIMDSRCVVVCTSPNEPCSYFWLGFAHGLEKDVIPVTVVEENEAVNAQGQNPIRSLPFDVRALWHIYFSRKDPKALDKQMLDILEIISAKGQDTKYRRGFWQEILDSGSVSIFVGSVELTEKNKRHVVGEWDYRTVSELVSFLSTIKETMETAIQTPIFQTSSEFSNYAADSIDIIKSREINRLKGLLFERNSIIVGSADVNDMTEVAFSTYAGRNAFEPGIVRDPDFYGIVGFKSENEVAFKTSSIYFRSMKKDESEGERGYIDVIGGKDGDVKGRTRFSSKFVPYNEKTEDGYSVLYGHIAKFALNDKDKSRWVIIIQGISGPATLGLAQVLTGARYRQFTVFDNMYDREAILGLFKNKLVHVSPSVKEFYADFGNRDSVPNMEEHSEHMTSDFIKTFNKFNSAEAIVKIFVKDGEHSTHDERKIMWWDYECQPREMSRPKQRS